MAEQPQGTVTLLFSDIEGSTRLLQELGRQRYADALALHRELLREAFAQHRCYEFAPPAPLFPRELWRSA
jgi:class 3 adenylate cyclase